MTDQADTLPRLIRAFQVAMTDEQMPADVIERVVSRVVYGDPAGPCARHAVEQERQEIEIHITTPGPPPGTVPLALAEARRRRLLPPIVIRG